MAKPIEADGRMSFSKLTVIGGGKSEEPEVPGRGRRDPGLVIAPRAPRGAAE
jgi:hypothetical protein